MTVSELLSRLLDLEINGYGDKRVYIECSSNIEETTVTSINDITPEVTGVYIQI